MAATDANSFSYSGCGSASSFGVGWYVGAPPVVQHNGDEPGLSGSDTHVDPPAKMAATGLISTEPFPQHKPVQPAGLDGGFVTTAVSGMLNAGKAADKSTDWTGQTLAIGVARVLWLSGKAPQPNDLGAFTPAFATAHGLGPANIVAYLNKLHSEFGACATFRVSGVSTPQQIDLHLQCAVKDFDTQLTVEAEAPHRVAWSWVPPPIQGCPAACNVEENQCMQQAHSAADRKECVAEKTNCCKGVQ